MSAIVERYADDIVGTLDCPDRVIITGTLPVVCFAEGMTGLLLSKDIRIFDYLQFVSPLRDRIRESAEALAKASGLEIEYIPKKNFRKEDRIHDIIKKRGNHPGLVHIFSAMEACTAYRPWHDKPSGLNKLKTTSGKCIHYYFYFIHEQVGLCYLRVPTWCPFRLQFYFNGHNWLARQMDRQSTSYELVDNAFVQIDDWIKAQEIVDHFDVKNLHRILDQYAALCCPVADLLGQSYHWSIMQAEYASDIVFRSPNLLQPLYETISRTAIHAVKPNHVATFLGKKLPPQFKAELGNHYHTRIQGTSIKHQMAGKAAIKMYDKLGRVLRIETTVNDVTFFRHYRKVEHRNGTHSLKDAPMKKSIYSFSALVRLCLAANRRYLAFISEIEDSTAGLKDIKQIAETKRVDQHNYPGFNLLCEQGHQLFLAIARGEFAISGMTNRALQPHLPKMSSSQISRTLKRLRVHGIIKRVGRTYKYYLTTTGRALVAAALKLREITIIPTLAHPSPGIS